VSGTTRRVVVFGASGFLGTALCNHLVRGGAEVHGVSRTAQSKRDDVHWWQADVTRIDDATRVMTAVRPEIVFNFAGVSDGRTDLDRVLPLFTGNAQSSVVLLCAAAAAGCRRFIQCASLQEPRFGPTGSPPTSAYAISKWVQSAYVDLFYRHYQLPTVVLRLGIVYGPGEESAQRLVPHVITQLLRGEAPRLSSGAQLVDWIYLEDAVAAFVAAMDAAGAIGQTLNLGWGEPISVRAMAELIARTIDSGVNPVFGAVPDRPVVPTQPAEPSIALAALGWRARTPLEEGLRTTIEWYRRRLH
jgi:UDP-glucose 4-epimerase